MQCAKSQLFKCQCFCLHLHLKASFCTHCSPLQIPLGLINIHLNALNMPVKFLHLLFKLPDHSVWCSNIIHCILGASCYALIMRYPLLNKKTVGCVVRAWKRSEWNQTTSNEFIVYLRHICTVTIHAAQVHQVHHLLVLHHSWSF